MPIRPAAWVALVAELESRDVRPPGSLNHAGLLIGGATYLYRRHMPATLRPPLCRVQEIPQYADASGYKFDKLASVDREERFALVTSRPPRPAAAAPADCHRWRSHLL